MFCFENGGEPSTWIGSADLMHRNLDRRVEVLVELPSAREIEQVRSILDLAFDAGTSAWHLDAEGTWTRRHLDAEGNSLLDLQEAMITNASRRRAPVLTPRPTAHHR